MLWSEFLAEVRADLQDTGATPRWSDGVLYTFSKDAIRDYSTWFPRRIDRLEIVEVSDVYPLPSDFIDDITVESPIGTFLETRRERPGNKYLSRTKPFFYFIQGGNLYFDGAPSEGVFLTYHAVHAIPPSDIDELSDGDFEFTIPDMDIELPRLYIQAKVHAQMRAKTARLDRFQQGSGRRDDNPILPETNSLLNEYHFKIAQRLSGGAVRLYRYGSTR
jgi:hypothetical protein